MQILRVVANHTVAALDEITGKLVWVTSNADGPPTHVADVSSVVALVVVGGRQTRETSDQPEFRRVMLGSTCQSAMTGQPFLRIDWRVQPH